MAWVNEVNNSSFLVVDDWGPPRSDYAGCYAKATLAIETSGDTVKYKVTMYTEVDGSHSKKPGVSLYLSIDGQVIFNDYWVYSTTSASWNGFPTLNGSSRSGSITTKANNDSSIPVVLKIATTQTFSYADSIGQASKNITRTWYTNGTVSKPVIKDNSNNTFNISGSVTDGTNNTFKSAKIYYTTNGSTPTTSSSSKTISGSGNYSFDINVPSNASSSTVKAWISCNFEHNTVTATATDKTVKYYVNGTAPSKPVITDLGNNTYSIKCTTGYHGWNNPMKSATLYYTVNGTSYSKALSTTNGATGSFTLTVPSSKATSTILAYATCVYDRNTATSATATETVDYHTVIGKPSISITDNYNNTFTISGTNATNGTNNTASTVYQWGYSTSYGNSGTGTKNLSIATSSNATRTVYAKATATPSWSSDSAKTVTTSLAIRQYVAPANPGAPVISYTRNRLTIKENWTFTWPAATATNTSSPIKGYRIRLYKNGSLITGLTSGADNTISKGTGTNEWVDRENTSCTVILNPIAFGFLPGDTVQLGIYAYTRTGVNNAATQIFNGGGTTAAQVNSATYTVQNAGIVRVKPDGTWREGQVYVKVDGSWREAETVSVKADNVWKESQ